MGVEPFAYPCNDKLEYSYSLGYKDVTFPSGNTIRFVSFNTALLSFMPSSKISSDKMWIGQKQVKSLMKYGIIPNSDVHYTIALFHHAERFLHPSEVCEYDGRLATLNLLRENVDLILCGHTETGGLPILYKQVGGGMLLTAGATYYNDTHPNAFSLLCIPDNAKDVFVKPYTYKKGWQENKPHIINETLKELNEVSPAGDFQNKCNFVIRSGDKTHIIPIKKASVYTYTKNGNHYIKIDNRKEVLRYLDITIDGTPDGKKTNVSVGLAPKMERNVQGTPTSVVSIMMANNEIGTIQPFTPEIESIVHENGALFHTDAVQAVGHIKIDVKKIGVDLLSASAHKFNGPKGIGFLYVKKGTKLLPFMDGGAQERRMRAGTENVAGIVGMAIALKNNCVSLEKNQQHLLFLEDRLISQLNQTGIDYIRNGSGDHLPGNVSLSFKGKDGEAILHRMDLMGISISTGSACDSVNNQVSHVIQAIQLENEFARGTSRVVKGK